MALSVEAHAGVVQAVKILQIAGSGTIGTASAGPVSSTITQLANALTTAGYEVSIADAPATEDRLKLRSSIEVHEILPHRQSPPGMRFGMLGSIMRARSDFQCLRRFLGNMDHDVLHVHDSGQALVGGLFHDGKVLWTSHGMNWTMEPAYKTSRRGPRAMLERWVDLAACRLISHSVVLNRQTLTALTARNVSMIPNGIDLQGWPAINRQEARCTLGIPEEDFLVTYVGRVAPVKGVEVYVQAVEKAAREVPLNADAIGSLSGMFGHSNHITDYAEQIRSSGSAVNFRGFIHRDNPEYRLRLAAADAVVIPSLTEPFGLVVLEALACGARVIGSDVGGIRDMLADRRGILVPAGDPDALAAVIVDLHVQRNCAGSTAGRGIDLTDYDWTHIAARYGNLMNSLPLQDRPS